MLLLHLTKMKLVNITQLVSLACVNSWLTFDGHSISVNNDDIDDGDIALYKSSKVNLPSCCSISKQFRQRLMAQDSS